MTLTRRNFLATPFLARAAAAAAARPDRDGRILVVLQLAGGNDGLNTVVPYEDDRYGRARTTLRLTGSQVLKIGSSPGSNVAVGLHPSLAGMARLYREGRLTVVQGVGYPNMHRDHNSGMRSWQTGVVSAGEQTGWLGRTADRVGPADTPVAFVGSIAAPFAVQSAEAIVPAIHDARDWTLSTVSTFFDARRPDAPVEATARAMAGGFAGARRTAGVLKTPGSVEYPDLPLAQSFRSVAQLIRAELGVRIFLVEQGGVSPGEFDNHANQAVNHAVSLRDLSQSVTAFCDDLAHDRLLDRILLMTFSEFGRTLTENGRHGTGHGAAAPVFLAGARVKGGLSGEHPGLADLENDALKPHTDFRSVYATVLESWLGIPAFPILGGPFPPLDVIA